ncbi:hypothetical protein GC087_06045 [Pantoea sp. JZ2]|nr:hypothetical protein GC087_06045 [Pantoea sp. JZ2]
MKSKNLIVRMLIASTLTLGGCTSYDSVQLDKHQLNDDYTFYKLSPPLYEGDVVRYKLTDGVSNTITVKKATPQSIISSTEQTIPFKDMAVLERKEISKGKTAAAAAAGIGGTAVVVGAILLIGLGAGFAAVLSGG